MIVRASEVAEGFLAYSVVTIGSFDGVHRGHQALLGKLRRLADEQGGVPTVVTFGQHPRSVLGSGQVRLLTTPTERNELLEEYGAEYVVELSFTPELAALTAEEFMRDFLIGQLGATALLLGYDHSFGSDRHTTPPDHIEQLGERYGLKVVRYEPLMVEGGEVSSSEIRTLLERGHVDYVIRLLGRPYTINCRARNGHLVPHDGRKVLPAAGSYRVSWCLNDEPEELYHDQANPPVVELVSDVLVVTPRGELMVESAVTSDEIMLFFEERLE